MDEIDIIIINGKYDFSHVWVDGFGWENTIFLASDFWKINKMPFKDKDGSSVFMAYEKDFENPTKFKGTDNSNY